MANRNRTPIHVTIAVAIALAASLSCDQDVVNVVHVGTLPETTSNPATPRRVFGVAEVSFRDMNTVNVSSSIRLATTVADLERLRSSAGSGGNLDVIEIDPIVTGEFLYTPVDVAPRRFIWATYAVRNAAQTKIVDSLRNNVSFVAIATVQTFKSTPVRTLQRADGVSAAASMALQITPTELMAVDGEGKLVTIADDVMKSLTADDTRKTTSATGVSSLFGYSFGVRKPLGVTPALLRTADGVVTFAFSMPAFPKTPDDLASLSIVFVIVNDTAAPRS
jgi:hypothetical protein